MNTNGGQRPKTLGLWKYSAQTINESNLPTLAFSAAVSYSGAAAAQKYLDMQDQTQWVCSGIPQLFVNHLGILTTDTLDGALGSFRAYWQGYLNILSSDTPGLGDTLYWDATNKRLTTTASSHKKAGTCMSATLTVVSTAVLGSLPVGSWVNVFIHPMI
jgi:hypothetical protein